MSTTSLARVISVEDESSLSLGRRTELLNKLAWIMIVGVLANMIESEVIQVRNIRIFFFILFALGFLVLILNKRGYFKLAAVLGITAFDSVIFLVASSEPYETAVSLHLISTGFVSLVFFGRDNRWLGFFLVGCSALCYGLAGIGGFSILEFKFFTKEQCQTLFIFNSTLYTITSIYLFMLVMSLNHRAKITLEKNKQEIVEQNQRLEKANKELDRFIYSSSHDLRAPLSSISGLITLAEASPQEASLYVPMMKDRIGVMDKFMKEIVTYARNARLQVEPEKIRIRAMTEEIIEILKYANPTVQFTFNVYIDPALELYTDRSRLSVVLNNLVSNSIKYSDAKKEKPFIKISASTNAGICSIVVEDNGIGIQQEHLPKVFDMFYRATDRSKGSGLGLFIVKEALEKLKGDISIESTYGQGTRFTIHLPTHVLSE